MSTVIINHSDTRGGASVVSIRLLDALRAQGEDASMLVAHKGGDNPHVFRAAPPWRTRIPFYAEHLRIFAGNGFSRSDLFKASIATDGLPLASHPLVREADTVILNWINQGMLSLDEIEKMAAAGKRILWTMHDMWNAVGICHHAGTCSRFTEAEGCRRCPLLHGRASDKDLSAATFARKKALYSCAGITFIAVSEWLARRCRESTLMRDADIRVIPNAFPVDTYSPYPTKSRRELGLPDGNIIIMAAARLDDPVKGLDMAVDALGKVYAPDAVAVFVGDLRNRASLDDLRMPYKWLGPVDIAAMPHIYAHASVVLSSSRYETLPTTLVEGMAAGAFPVAFDSGGQADIITEGAGALVPPYDTSAMAAEIDAALRRKPDRQALHDTARRFAPDRIAQRYISRVHPPTTPFLENISKKHPPLC